jgi:DNA mismatch repair protein MutS
MVDEKELTPAMRQYKDMKRRYPDSFIFFRMGDFYEMFYEDAVEGSKILNIALTSRGKGRDGEPIPLCGVPYHALQLYLARMIRAGKKVAICEQMEDPKLAKGVVKRDVVRVVTPGTVTEEAVLSSPYPNYIASVLPPSDNSGPVGVAFADLSTGEFQTAELDGANPMQELNELLSQFRPKEILLPEERHWDGLDMDAARDVLVTAVEKWAYGADFAEREMKSQFGVARLEGFGLSSGSPAVGAAGALIHYLKETQKQELSHIKNLRKISRSDYLILDSTSRRNLELVSSIYGDGISGTLLKVMDKSVTGMGKRMMRDWLLMPLRDRKKIETRLDAVQELFDKPIERSGLRAALKRLSDLERIIGRLTMRSGGPRDLVALKLSLEQLPSIKRMAGSFENGIFKGISEGFDLLDDIRLLIEKAINEQPPVTVREGGIIKDGYNEELDSLRDISRSGKKYIAGIETAEKQRSGIQTLKVKYNKVFGYYIEVSNSHLEKVPADYIRKQTLVNAERFITPELKEYEARVLGADEKINDLEFDLFSQVRDQVGRHAYRVQETALRIAAMDVIASLAELASAAGYCRPEILESDILDIKDGRHPVVEQLNLDEKFIPNDCRAGGEERILIITGPNMGGKSTYLRQVALIVIMAQMGSFVPAKEARIGIADRVFTRVGASDSLVQGRSTFLVEMQETADILNNATPGSLIILDEVGRGTSTFDGLSIAWAVVEYIATMKTLKARTLFATHYHELTELAILYPGIKNLNLAVKEWKDQVIFLRKVVEGGADKSYGIQVARLAGIPPAVIERSKEILCTLEEKELDENGKPVLGHGAARAIGKFEPSQQSLFASHFEDPLIEELKKLEIEKITPLQSMHLLEKIIKRIKN